MTIFHDKCDSDFNNHVMFNNFLRLIDRFGSRLAYFTFKSTWHVKYFLHINIPKYFRKTNSRISKIRIL